MLYLILVPALLLAAYFAASALYFFLFSVASHFYREGSVPDQQAHEKVKLAVLYPAYKEDAVILESAASAQKHLSRLAHMDVHVIADSLQPSTIGKLKQLGVQVVEVSFEKSTKVKSLQRAVASLSPNTDMVVVMDADNLMQEGFIDRLVERMRQGFRIVQGHRTFKNLNTHMAVLDSISEEVNNSIFRLGHRSLGLSASLIGSGFACEYRLFRELIDSAGAVGGFDKELEVMLLERRIPIGYGKQAVVLDEKVQQAGVFVNQRRRWLAAQFVYLGKNLGKAFRKLLREGNIDLFDKVMQFLLPPRIIALGLTALLFALHTIFFLAGHAGWNAFFAALWGGIFVLNSMAIALAIPRKMYNTSMIRALASLPAGFFLTIKALLRTKGANKRFIHTRHGVDEGKKRNRN